MQDVLEWHYTGNRRHPTEKSVDTLRPIIEEFSNAGDLVLDPYSGIPDRAARSWQLRWLGGTTSGSRLKNSIVNRPDGGSTASGGISP